MPLSINLVIHTYLKRNHYNLSHLASSMGYTRSAFYRLLHKPDMPVSILLAFCKHFNHNFFTDLFPPDNSLTPREAQKLRRENIRLQQEISRLSEQINLLNLQNQTLSTHLAQLRNPSAAISPQPSES